MLLPKTRKSLIFVLLLFVLPMSMPCRAETDDFDFDLFLEDDGNKRFIDDNPPIASNPCDPKVISMALVDLGLIPVLQENFYARTNELTQRSLLDYPIFLPRRWTNYTSTYGFDLFWNKTNRMYFSQSSSNISSYINIGPSALLDALSNAHAELTRIAPLIAAYNPEKIAPLFRNFTVEQRRIGFMFHAEKRIKKVFFYMFLPIYYIERNMFASEIEQEALTLTFGRLDQQSQDTFAKNHLISDQFGLGDTRMSVDFQIKDSPEWGFNLGFFMTLPTAFAFKQGIEGSTYHKTGCPPTLDIENLACQGIQGTQEQKDAAIAQALDFGFKALDNLAANILQTPLGNGGHVGLGVALQTDSYLRNFIKRPWAEALNYRSRVSLEYLFPNVKTRYFLLKDRSGCFEALGLNNAQSLIASNVGNNDAYATSVLNFFDQQIAQEFFPPAFSVKVHPGFIFRSTSKAFHEGDHWFFALGNDFWLQSKEELNRFRPTGDCKTASKINADDYKLHAAQKPVAYQGKIWGTIAYKVLRNDVDWALSFNVDQTYLKSGIGADYTIALGFDAHF
jgi:hypothetical protein